MKQPMLEIKDLWVEIEDKKILKGVNLSVEQGKSHVIFGPNGSGKSTLLGAIMGLPDIKITQGEISFRGELINDLEIDQRVKKGIGIGFQYPPTVEGVELKNLLEYIEEDGSKIESIAKDLKFEDDLKREVNQGFSGGERKRNEILQLLLQEPQLILLDEPDSGIDLGAMKLISKKINSLLQRDRNKENRENSGLIITHNGGILEQVEADYGHVMVEGVLSPHSNPEKIFEQVNERGYRDCYQCLLEDGEC